MATDAPLLSIVIPVFNEAGTLQRVVQNLHEQLGAINFEIIVVDDGSTDGTAEIARKLTDARTRTFFHTGNQGKGAALRTAIEHATGSIVVIQDADMEYDPKDIPTLIQPILDGKADVVFGCRFHGLVQRVHLYWHRVANKWLTWWSNLFNNINLSDMETGYKAFRKDILDKIQIREDGFGVEPELTAKAVRLKCRIYEVPISYFGRDYAEGKKIGFYDAIWAAWCIVRYRFMD